MPSLCLQPATSQTAAVRTTPTSWKISSCKMKNPFIVLFVYIFGMIVPCFKRILKLKAINGSVHTLKLFFAIK